MTSMYALTYGRRWCCIPPLPQSTGVRYAATLGLFCILQFNSLEAAFHEDFNRSEAANDTFRSASVARGRRSAAHVIPTPQTPAHGAMYRNARRRVVLGLVMLAIVLVYHDGRALVWLHPFGWRQHLMVAAFILPILARLAMQERYPSSQPPSWLTTSPSVLWVRDGQAPATTS